MTPVFLNDRAKRELAEARQFYRGRGPGLVPRFRQAARDALARIVADPASLPLQPGSSSVRRVGVAGFPYDLLFKVRPGGVEVLSVWHRHRNPADRPG